MTFKETEIETDDDVAREAPTSPVDITKINTLHELLALAIGDFEKVLEDDRYAINMSSWHAPGPDGDDRCHVCLAGSVLAKTFQLGLDVDADTFETRVWSDERLSDRLHALDDLRLGDIRRAYYSLNDDDGTWDTPAEVDRLHDKWRDAIPPMAARAIDRRGGRELLGYLKTMHADLVEGSTTAIDGYLATNYEWFVFNDLRSAFGAVPDVADETILRAINKLGDEAEGRFRKTRWRGTPLRLS